MPAGARKAVVAKGEVVTAGTVAAPAEGIREAVTPVAAMPAGAPEAGEAVERGSSVR